MRISDWSSDVCSSDLLHQPDDDELTGLAGLDFGWQLSPAIKLTQTASTIIGETTTSTSSLTALNAKLSGGLSARIAYRSEEHTSELQSLMRISYAVFCLKTKNNKQTNTQTHHANN